MQWALNNLNIEKEMHFGRYKWQWQWHLSLSLSLSLSLFISLPKFLSYVAASLKNES
jgi:hypothetical protein